MALHLAARLAARASSLADDDLLVIAARAPVTDVRCLLEAPDSRLLWDAGDLEPGRHRLTVAGRGEAIRLDASGPGRLGAIRVAAALAARRWVIDDGDLDLTPPRFFGGISFEPAPAPGGDAIQGSALRGAWSAFGDASFVMPRFVYARRGTDAWIRLAVRGAELRDPARLLEEIRGVEATLERAEPARSSGELAAELEPMSAGAWEELVGDALARIRVHELEKVVAARQTAIAARGPIDVAAVLRRLRGTEPGCVEFAMQRGAAVFLGATPERLVVKVGTAIETEALAGTIRRDEPSRGAGLEGGFELLRSDKDRREQDLVVKGIRAALEPLCVELDVPAAPAVRTLRTVHHLSTAIRGQLRRPAHVLEVLEALHPTPAVSGLPRERAIDWIAAHEPSPRGWYASPVGWFDAAGDGAFAVAIRSALIEGAQAFVYAGAGIVEGSDPRLEYAETSLKQAAMLSALGVSA